MTLSPSAASPAAAGLPDADLLARLRALVGAIPDPEIPVVSLAELGIVRDLRWADGAPVAVLTPTYSGCPATEMIAGQVRELLVGEGFGDARIEIALAPAWTTDWITEDGRRKLRAYGIAPPGRCADDPQSAPGTLTSASIGNGGGGTTSVLRFAPRPAGDGPACPRCDSPNVEELSRYGSTPCKSLYRCRSCREPFDFFKPY